MQLELEKILRKSDFWLCTDDGLALFRNINRQYTEKVRKNIIRESKDFDFSLEIETILKEVDFLDISLNLQNVTYHPYKKQKDTLFYIHSLSNHPPNVLKPYDVLNSVLHPRENVE